MRIGETLMGQPDQFHGSLQAVFIIHHGGDITLFRRPTVRLGFAPGESLSLCVFCQLDVAVAVAVDVREHFVPNKKGVFMDAGILPFRHTGQGENPPPEFLVQFMGVHTS